MTKMKSLLIAFAILIALMVGAGSAFSAANQADCEALAAYVAGLTDEALNQPITNVTATWYPANPSPPPPAQPTPEYCEVKGRIFPETDFAVRLPTAWQGRLVHFGGGAWDGFVGGADKTSLDLGFAGSASNGGHNGSPLSGAFGLKDPYYRMWIDPNNDNPYACQKIIDFGHRALRETPLVAKKIIKHYYGLDAHHTYYSGASTGGREGLVEAQKNYDLFDGVYIGAPTGGHVAVTVRGLWDSVQGVGLAQQADPACVPTPPFGGCPSIYTKYKAALHHKSVYDKCDGVDGLVDGLIDDPLKCNFNALTDLPACTPDEEALEAAGIYSSTCFTLAQRQALAEIYRGPHNRAHHHKSRDCSGQLYVGQPLSAEYLTDPNNPNSNGFGSALFDILMGDMYRYWAFDPPPGPTWDMLTFNWETDPQVVKESTCTQCYGGTCKTYSLTAELDAVTLSPAVAPNMGGLAPLKAKGGKMIHYHGWGDSLVSPLTSTRFYETVMSQMGVAKTKSFYKLYMAPGLGHVTGGIGYLHTWTDAMTALVNWVENGIEPDSLIGTRNPNSAWGWPTMTRPLCPYPEVARYSGTGSIWEAANFMCVPPIEVRIEPEMLNLKRKKGEFVAFITVPHDYHIKDWNLHDITCEGAPAKYGFAHGNVYYARFRTQDLQNVTPGKSVTLTVKGVFQKDGKGALVQGSDTVMVIK
jgi:feruloyl esterase